MTSLVDRGISVYREHGMFTLLKKTLKKVRLETDCRLASALGQYSLTLNNQEVMFSAPTSKLVQRNRQRFRSESKELCEFLGEIRQDDVIYDIGANTGLYSLFAAKMCPQGTVAAFEPYPPNVRILQQDITRNNLENVEVIEFALSNSVGEIEFSQPESDDIGYGSSSIDTDGTEGGITIPTTTGNALVASGEIPSPNIVKIDVEGAESLVLEGLEEIISPSSCRAIYCEVHLPGVSKRPAVQDFGSSLQEVESQLEECGFSVYRLQTERDSEVTIKAESEPYT
ncbi:MULTISPECIES: FkbM family methyltransferase [Halobacterium]|uniref:FkbM family methyltransferase n=1 Tax=Halobacterium TaxID=2239 RepID=UPI00196309E2|nr:MULTISPECIES: FkbM family methyltransferase [Halobacterium]MCF2164667.1 FkbM family methyltransferase [Halobacterium salinarum]MCF2166887.1 FkbM family methyltransferase [Halobacterium salinarum]QRY22773.1 FkbM family methyltransferase [Halobacterium sp. GSL-19]WJK64081.1 FkbM family methyltransferase [Halobacterium salinarum]